MNHHHAVLPVISATPELKQREYVKSPAKDPYAALPDKPNKLTSQNTETLQALI